MLGEQARAGERLRDARGAHIQNGMYHGIAVPYYHSLIVAHAWYVWGGCARVRTVG